MCVIVPKTSADSRSFLTLSSWQLQPQLEAELGGNLRNGFEFEVCDSSAIKRDKWRVRGESQGGSRSERVRWEWIKEDRHRQREREGGWDRDLCTYCSVTVKPWGFHALKRRFMSIWTGKKMVNKVFFVHAECLLQHSQWCMSFTRGWSYRCCYVNLSSNCVSLHWAVGTYRTEVIIE